MFHTIGDSSGTCIFFIDRTEEWTVFANLKLGNDKKFYFVLILNRMRHTDMKICHGGMLFSVCISLTLKAQLV